LNIGRRVKELRESWSLSQRQLADVLELKNSQSISDIEKGNRALKAYELSLLSGYFHITIEELLGLKNTDKPVVQWRSNNLPVNLEDESKFIQRCRNYKYVTECTGYNHSRVLPQIPNYSPQTTSYEDVNELAHGFRKALSLGDKPAYSIRSALEDEWGICIFLEKLSDSSAACTKGKFGLGILVNSEDSRWRQNYSLGHELFHLITWGDEIQPLEWSAAAKKRNETLADVFASALLMPEESVRSDFKKLVSNKSIQWYDILMLARSYDVSTISLLWRLTNLDLIPKRTPKDFQSSNELSKLDRDLSRGENISSPHLPERYVRLAYKAYNDNRISIGRLAELLETSVSELGDELQQYDILLYDNAYKATISTA